MPADYATAKKFGSPLDTDLERISPCPRINHLGAVVRDRKWCPVAITNSLCVKSVRVSQLLNTPENLSRWRRCSGGHPQLHPSSRLAPCWDTDGPNEAPPSLGYDSGSLSASTAAERARRMLWRSRMKWIAATKRPLGRT